MTMATSGFIQEAPPQYDVVNTEKSGGTRFSAGKPAGWWYVPMAGLRLVARVAMFGARKYAPLDWAEGQSFSTLFDCMTRHYLAMQEDGIWSRDEDSGLYHAAHLGWNVLCLLTFMQQERHDLDDITKWRGVTTAQKQKMEEAARAKGRKEMESASTIMDEIAQARREHEADRKRLTTGGGHPPIHTPGAPL